MMRMRTMPGKHRTTTRPQGRSDTLFQCIQAGTYGHETMTDDLTLSHPALSTQPV